VTAIKPRPTLDSGTRVAIIDDQDDNAFAMELMLGRFCAPIRVPIVTDINDMLNDVVNASDYAVFDHRLGAAKGAAVNYTGAEAAAKCRIPSILVSTYIDEDRTSIRAYQAAIPRVLTRATKKLSPEDLHEALLAAGEEKAGRIAPNRVPYRTIVRVVDVVAAATPRAHVVVTAWRPEEPVTIPASMITNATGRAPASLAGRRFLADVNIYAADPTDLYFDNFADVNEMPSEWMAARYGENSDNSGSIS
jgi:hypothetical protein